MSFLLPLFMATGGASVVYELSNHRAYTPEVVNRVAIIKSDPAISGSESDSTTIDRTCFIGAQMRVVKVEKEQRIVFIEYESRTVTSGA